MVVHSAHVKSDAPACGDESRYGSIPEINREMALGDSTLRCRGRAAIHGLVGVLGAATLLTALVAVALIQAGGDHGVVTQTSALLQVGVLVCIPLPPSRSLSFLSLSSTLALFVALSFLMMKTLAIRGRGENILMCVG